LSKRIKREKAVESTKGKSFISEESIGFVWCKAIKKTMRLLLAGGVGFLKDAKRVSSGGRREAVDVGSWICLIDGVIVKQNDWFHNY
jgi:hypothetical protein